MENKNLHIADGLSLSDKNNFEGPRLKGVIEIHRENKKTGERKFVERSTNIIPISGYQWILMKMFGLHLDSSHNTAFEDIGRDTNVIIPDLNNSGTYQLGVDPTEYSEMVEDISDAHFIQGFMIGNGGSAEDSITTKNTDYSFTKLRNPIPFQQTQTALPTEIAGQYLGKLRVGSSSFSKSYFIKKFDERPYVYNGWWKSGQRWDYSDPITQNDLGPNPVNGVGKTDRIETYASATMSLDEDDCISYFSHDGSSQTAMVNELGLVAFDAKVGIRSIIEKVYNDKIKKLLSIVFDNNRDTNMNAEVISLASDIHAVLSQLTTYGQTNINEFISTMNTIAGYTPLSINYATIKNALSSAANIEVNALYNQNGVYVREEDKFLTYMSANEFATLTTDEAQRIKLITYYTFNAIPLESNWKIIIDYRIYAN